MGSTSDQEDSSSTISRANQAVRLAAWLEAQRAARGTASVRNSNSLWIRRRADRKTHAHSPLGRPYGASGR
jgi:hypothetical protein